MPEAISDSQCEKVIFALDASSWKLLTVHLRCNTFFGDVTVIWRYRGTLLVAIFASVKNREHPDQNWS